MERLSLIILTIIPGVAGVAIFGFYALQDWTELVPAYQAFLRATSASADLPTLFKANALQNIQRINLFADGVWTLLSAILGGIGVHGLYLKSKR